MCQPPANFSKTNPTEFVRQNRHPLPRRALHNPQSQKPKKQHLLGRQSLTPPKHSAPVPPHFTIVMEMRKQQANNTGPHTPHGKTRSSQNSTKHALRSNPRKLLPAETQAEVDAIRASWEAEFDLDSPAIESLLTPLIEADRMFRRSITALFDAEIALCQTGLTEEQLTVLHKQYQLILRYKTTHERAFRNALRTIEQFAGRRAREERAHRRQIIYEKIAAIDTVGKLFKYNLTPEAAFGPSPKTPPQPPQPGAKQPDPNQRL